MPSRRRKIAIAAVAGLALAALASHDHRADIEILTHRAGDSAPQRMQAVIDLGVIAVSVLVTWSGRLTG